MIFILACHRYVNICVYVLHYVPVIKKNVKVGKNVWINNSKWCNYTYHCVTHGVYCTVH